jgi:hypothetical protein
VNRKTLLEKDKAADRHGGFLLLLRCVSHQCYIPNNLPLCIVERQVEGNVVENLYGKEVKALQQQGRDRRVIQPCGREFSGSLCGCGVLRLCGRAEGTQRSYDLPLLKGGRTRPGRECHERFTEARVTD